MNKADIAVKKYIDKLILPSQPLSPLWNTENVLFKKKPKWNYIDSCMMTALLSLYDLTGDEKLAQFVCKFTDAYTSPDGDIPTIDFSDYNLDNLNGGRNLLRLFRMTGNDRYRLTAENMRRSQIAKQPRLNCGNFWHKAIYPFQIWLDGTYMSMPFMAEYACRYSEGELIADITSQLKNIRNIMHDKTTGLYFHGYDETKSMIWADKETGLSPNFWLRSIGWLSAALADICGIVPAEEELYRLCADMLDELLVSLVSYTDENGLLRQLPAVSGEKGNYTESSGNLLFSYSALKASRLGISGNIVRKAGEKAFTSVTDLSLRFDNELPVLSNICLMAGLGGVPPRNGSIQYYLGEKVVSNDAKGIAPYILAYTELCSS